MSETGSTAPRRGACSEGPPRRQTDPRVEPPARDEAAHAEEQRHVGPLRVVVPGMQARTKAPTEERG